VAEERLDVADVGAALERESTRDLLKRTQLLPKTPVNTSERASRFFSTLTEMTLTPAPHRGRPGLRRAFSQACPSAGRNGRDFATIISRSNSFVASCSSPSLSEAYFDTRLVVPFVMPVSGSVAFPLR
jgi:hypothetical protein